MGGLFSPTEACVNPRKASGLLSKWLAEEFEVQFEWNTTITRVESGHVTTASGDVHPCDQVIICSGADFETLFPVEFSNSGLKKCKLQMLRTEGQAAILQIAQVYRNLKNGSPQRLRTWIGSEST
jgi:glycine/D-amino acid oxidase-like deaminating enzyme